MWMRSMHHLGGWGVTTASMEAAEDDPGSMEVIWMTARSLDPTGRYRRPFSGVGTGSASSASSIPPFSIPPARWEEEVGGDTVAVEEE